MTFRCSVALIGVSLLALAMLSLLRHFKQENITSVANTTTTELCIRECTAINCAVEIDDLRIEGGPNEPVCIQVPISELGVNWHSQDDELPYVDPIFGGPIP